MLGLGGIQGSAEALRRLAEACRLLGCLLAAVVGHRHNVVKPPRTIKVSDWETRAAVSFDSSSPVSQLAIVWRKGKFRGIPLRPYITVTYVPHSLSALLDNILQHHQIAPYLEHLGILGVPSSSASPSCFSASSFFWTLNFRGVGTLKNKLGDSPGRSMCLKYPRWAGSL